MRRAWACRRIQRLRDLWRVYGFGYGQAEHRDDDGLRLRALFQERLEIRPRVLGFALGGFGGFAEAEIAVDEAEAVVIAGRHAGRGKRVGVGLALVPERI